MIQPAIVPAFLIASMDDVVAWFEIAPPTPVIRPPAWLLIVPMDASL